MTTTNQILRSLTAIGLVAVLASCGGGNRGADEGEGDPVATPSLRIDIQPDPAIVVQESSLVVRVDLIGANNQAPGAYEIDFDERQSRVGIETAPCPAALGRPGCQEWTISPREDAVPGVYTVRLRSVGLAAGLARGSFELRVVPAGMPQFRAATDVTTFGTDPQIGEDEGAQSASRANPRTFVRTSGDLAFVTGQNDYGVLASGHLQQPFLDEGLRDLESSLRVSPADIPFVLVAPDQSASGPLSFVSFAATDSASYGVSTDGRVWRWGSLTGVGPHPRPESLELTPRAIFRLLPQPGVDIDERITAVSSVENHALVVLTSRGRVWAWITDRAEEDPSIGGDPWLVRDVDGGGAALNGVRAISRQLVLMNDGRVVDIHRPLYVGRLERPQVLPVGPPVGPGDVPRPLDIIQVSDSRFRSAALDSTGTLWSVSALGPPLLGVNDITAIAMGEHSGDLYLLRRNSPSVWFAPAAGIERYGPMIEIQAPAGRRFVRVAPGYGITDDCGEMGGRLWRLDHQQERESLRAYAEAGFGEVDPSCAEAETLRLTVLTQGEGRVVVLPGGIECIGSCQGRFRRGSRVTLMPVPAPGSRFVRWESDQCSARRTVLNGTGNEVVEVLVEDPHSYLVDPAAVQTCTAVFEPAPPAEHRLTIHSNGGGTVISDPQGIICGRLCSRWFATDQDVRLTATAQPGHRFDGFAGDPDCADGSVTLSAAVVCSARFTALAPPLPLVPLQLSVAGNGRVLGEGFSCGVESAVGDCRRELPVGEQVRLTAEPDEGHRLAGWSDDCDSFGTSKVITIQVGRAMTCGAVFEPGYYLSMVVTGNGNVAADGLSCVPVDDVQHCRGGFPAGAQVTLTATAGEGHTFSGWVFDCTDGFDRRQNPLTVTMDRSKVCFATFLPGTTLHPLQVTVQGNGRVIGIGSGISCRQGSARCQEDFTAGSEVTLVAVADPNHSLVGWSDDCASFGTESSIALTMSRAMTCGAIFAPSGTRRIGIEVISAFGVVRDETGAAIDCRLGSPAESCEELYTDTSTITLRATADANNYFQGWGGDCSGFGMTQQIALETQQSVVCTADFGPTRPPDVELLIFRSTADVTSDPPGITCGNVVGNDCSETFPFGTVVQLTAAQWNVGWMRGPNQDLECHRILENNVCELIMDQDQVITMGSLVPVTLILVNAPQTATVTSDPATTPTGVFCTMAGGGTCSQQLPPGTDITLTLTPTANFNRWRNCTSVTGGNGESCQFTVAGATTIFAEYNP